MISYEGIGQDFKSMTDSARKLNQEFLAEQNLTLEKVQAWPKEKQKKLQEVYREWYRQKSRFVDKEVPMAIEENLKFQRRMQELSFLGSRAGDICTAAKMAQDEAKAGTYSPETKNYLIRRSKELLAIAEGLQ